MQVQEGIGNSNVYVNTIFTSELNRKKCTNLIFRCNVAKGRWNDWLISTLLQSHHYEGIETHKHSERFKEP